LAFQATREDRGTDEKSLLERGFDFGFESFFPGGLLGSLPVGAQQIVGWILDSPNTGGVVSPVVISERPTTSLPSGIGTQEVPSGWDLPPGMEYCEIAGELRICDRNVYSPTDVVLEEFDPGVVIGEVQGPDTAQQTDDVGENMAAWDWGAAASGVIDILQGQSVGGGGQQFVGGGQLPPAVITGNGVGGTGPISYGDNGKPCKRRRRRRLLTEGDFNDLMRIATLPNKDTVKVALAKAVGRR